ncbi:MAG: Fic family protein [Rhodoplanes sp.]|uniref:Fic/DOC family protein n=1 Tax=Rhodoplanes sp. TaxID=1968906 RepID=UPI0017B076BE|nr:Fic family protein [Rhodoplanes sp.]NVO15449.1 Fic family protein [Rhodoplanes sp.]
MYDAQQDPHCYPGTTVLRNRANIRDQAALDAFEHDALLQRSSEPMPAGRFSTTHYRAVHRHLFQDVYAWAGRFRTVRISKGGSLFCYPEHIGTEMDKLFAGLRRDRFFASIDRGDFAHKAAHFLAELNAVHPFREGNGRTQLAFITLLAEHAGHALDLDRMQPETMLDATIRSFEGDEGPLTTLIAEIAS